MGVIGRSGPRRFENVCRNGHTRTADNTYVRADGGRQCMDCPGWKRKNLSTKQRRLLDSGQRTLSGGPKPHRSRESCRKGSAATPPPPRWNRELSADELAYLRRIIPCCGCGMTQNAKGVTPHRPGCRVPFNTEDDGTAVPVDEKRAA